jgi:hypothetical protein
MNTKWSPAVALTNTLFPVTVALVWVAGIVADVIRVGAAELDQAWLVGE